jgi:opacity protein-like surface antigen
VHVSKNPAPPAPESFYNAHELQLGVSALLAARAGDRGPRFGNRISDQEWGADLELAYFITRNLGVSVEQQYISAGRPIWNSAANVILRAPLHEGSRWAPYIFGGLGAYYASGQGRFEGHAGAGLEYRWTQKIGTFLDGRYSWVDGNNNNIPQFGTFRAGFRFVF